MCRHLAYLGRPRRLGELLVDPDYSLVRQGYQPRRQTSGVVNADGTGVGWYVEGDPVPGRHRSAVPIWSDATFHDLARVVTSGAFLGSIRSATDPRVHGQAAAAPFAHSRWLFSLNGFIEGWPASAARIAGWIDPFRLLGLEAGNDAAFMWALLRERLDAGQPGPQALGDIVIRLSAECGGRFNGLLTDGSTVAATAWGNSLCWRAVEGGIVVASEPYDDEPGWVDVPDRSLLTVRGGEVAVEPLREDEAR